MTDAAALRIDSISKRYGDFVAVDSLSLSVPAGTVFGLLGPNGAGKTTTLRMINDILSPDSGTIVLWGNQRPGPSASPRIGYLPEERGLYPKMKVLDALRFFGELRGVPGKEAATRARRWLDRMELGRWARHKVQDLSKGMQQKVQFITAVLHEPDLLVLDEPWSGLDPINTEVLLDIVREQKRANKTIVFSTHLMDSAERVCDAVCIMNRARKVLEGSVAALRRDAAQDRSVAIVFASLDDATRARAILADKSLVASQRESKDVVEVELAAGADAQELLATLVGQGVSLRRFELVQPSLHQIFIERVGADTAQVSRG